MLVEYIFSNASLSIKKVIENNIEEASALRIFTQSWREFEGGNKPGRLKHGRWLCHMSYVIVICHMSLTYDKQKEEGASKN